MKKLSLIAIVSFLGIISVLGQTTNRIMKFDNPPTTYVNSAMFEYNGCIGIGTTTANASMHLHSGGISTYLHLSNNTVTDAPLRGGYIGQLNSNTRFINFEATAGSGFEFMNGSNNNLLRIENTGNVGIGTYSPYSKLHIKGSGFSSATSSLNITDNDNRSLLFVRDDGKVGIGTTDPQKKLEVRDFGRFTSSSSSSNYIDIGHDGGNARIDSYGAGGLLINYNGKNVIIGTGPAGSVGIGTANFANSSGTNSSYYKLAVNGNVHVKELVVETGWSDFVFDKSYKLKPLNEVEKYISEHNHLPDVPSADEVAKNGVSVGQNASLLLQKIEELTLYLIELKKENELLKDRIIKIENKKI